MAIQTSLRVRKTFANKLASTPIGLNGRLIVVFVKDTVVVPTDAAGMKDYLYSVLNFSSNYGGGAGNRENILAFTTAAPTSITELSQANDQVLLSSNRAITPLKTGKIGSVLVFAPTASTTASLPINSATMASGNCGAISSLALATAATISTTTLGIPEALAVLTSHTTAVINYFGGVHFVTDSVGVLGSGACVQTSTLDLVSGTPFTLHGFSLKANLAS